MRRRMFDRFMAELAPGADDTVLDIGATCDRTYDSSNYFEAFYPYKARLTALGLDDASFLENDYPGLVFVRGDALDLPFGDGSFDFVHCSAVIEHVGSFDNQRRLVAEALRVARKGVFVTTPNRWFPVEVHTQIPLAHWLPKPAFRAILRALGQTELAQESNLNLMSGRELVLAAGRVQGWHQRLAGLRLCGLVSNLVLIARRDPSA